jgi:hypothetical protein
MEIKGEIRTCGGMHGCGHIRSHDHKQAPVRDISRVLTRGGLEEEENGEFKYRVYRKAVNSVSGSGEMSGRRALPSISGRSNSGCSDVSNGRARQYLEENWFV